VEFVDPLEVLGLTQQHQVGIAARADERERSKQVSVGEILTRRDELALVSGAAILVEPAPGGIDVEERVFDEMAYRNGDTDDTRAYTGLPLPETPGAYWGRR
jgi:hypothetical protein